MLILLVKDIYVRFNQWRNGGNGIYLYRILCRVLRCGVLDGGDCFDVCVLNLVEH